MNKFYCILSKTKISKTFLNLPKPVHIHIDELSDAFKLSNQEFKQKFKVDKPNENTEIYFKCRSGMTCNRAMFLLKDEYKCHNVNLMEINKEI